MRDRSNVFFYNQILVIYSNHRLCHPQHAVCACGGAMSTDWPRLLDSTLTARTMSLPVVQWPDRMQTPFNPLPM